MQDGCSTCSHPPGAGPATAEGTGAPFLTRSSHVLPPSRSSAAALGDSVLQRPQPHGWSADREHVLSCTLTLQIATGGSAGRRQLSFLGRLPSMHVASSEGVKLLV